MVKTLGMLFGIVFLAVGVLGFVPGVTSDVNGMPMLLGIFHVNTAHNLVHIVSGPSSSSRQCRARELRGSGFRSLGSSTRSWPFSDS